MAASLAQKIKWQNVCFSCRNRKLLLRRKQHTSVVASEYTDEAEYPPVKPRFPEGKNWGSMSSKVAWLWDERKQQVKKFVTAKDKLNHMTKDAYLVWKFPEVQLQPRLLNYQLNIMKTHMAEGLPELYQQVNVNEDLDMCKAAIIDVLELEDEVNREDRYIRKHCPYNLAHTHVKEIFTALYSNLVSRYEHLFTSQVDESVRVQAFWDRDGVKRYWPKERKMDPDYQLQNNVRFQADHLVNFQIRVERPLPEFYPRTDEMFTYLGYPESPYHPTVLGQFSESLQHKISTGAKLGSPCEFTMLSVLLSDHPFLQKLKKVSGEKYTVEGSIGYGITNSFTSAVAQAYYQGFNTHEELTYPFTTQTIVTDGQNYRLFAYQLNTLQMWLNDEANPLRNVCWVSKPLKLYETIEDGKVMGFDDSVLELVLKFMCLKPVERGIDLRPNLVPEDNTLSVREYIEEKKLRVEYEQPVRYAPER